MKQTLQKFIENYGAPDQEQQTEDDDIVPSSKTQTPNAFAPKTLPISQIEPSALLLDMNFDKEWESLF